LIHGRAAKKEKDLPVTMRKMEIREIVERREQAISDRERGSNKDGKSGGKIHLQQLRRKDENRY